MCNLKLASIKFIPWAFHANKAADTPAKTAAVGNIGRIEYHLCSPTLSVHIYQKHVSKWVFDNITYNLNIFTRTRRHGPSSSRFIRLVVNYKLRNQCVNLQNGAEICHHLFCVLLVIYN